MSKSILPDEWRGVTKTTGYRGVGKSYFASQIENPSLKAFFDFEKKGEGIDAKLHFGLYVPVTERASGGSVGVFDTFMAEVAKIKDNQFTHVILDNTAPLEQAMKSEAARNADKYSKQFGLDANNIRANRYGGQGGVVNYLISEICNSLWTKGVKLISVTSHIKPRWSGGVQVVNSFNVKGADRWDELSILALVLIPGGFAPIPAALVMKEQLGVIEFNEESSSFDVHRRLPYRLPKATPAAIKEYLLHPANLVEPSTGETPTDDEVQPFREKLSREQIKIVLAEIENEQASVITAKPQGTFSIPSSETPTNGDKKELSMPEKLALARKAKEQVE
jgi:hypothetical protein